MNYLRFNGKRRIEDEPFDMHLKNFDLNRLLVIDSIRVDEHSRLTVTKRMKDVLPIMAGDTITVFQDRYNKDLLFDIQHQSNTVNTWVIRKNPITISNIVEGRTTVKTYQEHLAEIIKNKSENVSSNYYNDNDAKILLIDDEEDLLTVYKLFLSSAGYTNLKAFSDPREGLKHVVDLKDPSHYDLAILDIRMGDINGIQLYQILKIMRPNIKVLFVSAAGCSRRDNDVLSRAKTE
jgi:CheY-like chemotaxis protein